MSLEQLTAKTPSWTGPYLYQPNPDVLIRDGKDGIERAVFNKGNILAVGAQIPVIGALAGITRMALAVIHCTGHVLATGKTRESGHFFHVIRGIIAFGQGAIESIPFFGRIFAVVHFNSKLIGAFARRHDYAPVR